MKRVMTSDLMQRIERTLEEFPELRSYTLKVGLVMHSDVHGNADSRNKVIRLNTRAKSGTTYFTIAHELGHLVGELDAAPGHPIGAQLLGHDHILAVLAHWVSKSERASPDCRMIERRVPTRSSG